MEKVDFIKAIKQAGSRKWNWVYFAVILANVVYVVLFYLINLSY